MYPSDKTLVNLKKADQIICLPCDKLKDHPMHFDFYAQSHLEELVCSIRETGLLEPVVVCPIKDDESGLGLRHVDRYFSMLKAFRGSASERYL